MIKKLREIDMQITTETLNHYNFLLKRQEQPALKNKGELVSAVKTVAEYHGRPEEQTINWTNEVLNQIIETRED
jgi:hypothetical protein